MSFFRVLVIFYFLFLPDLAFAHSGGTNADGCHRNRSTGDYHCHSARASGAYARQMDGLSRSGGGSESSNIFWWIAIGIGVFTVTVKLLNSSERSVSARSQSLNREPHNQIKTSYNKKATPYTTALRVKPVYDYEDAWWGWSEERNSIVVLFRTINCNQPGKKQPLIFVDCKKKKAFKIDFEKWKPPHYRYIKNVMNTTLYSEYVEAKKEAANLIKLAIDMDASKKTH
ncbi:YHYH domain-containing protein [Halomonas sp. AOP42-E1-30]|uniref:YHYH domain-containing protein n=1 Tax=Halomonas sp. AOP42-E1-30 TaxID=3457665 RepID=UPI0040345CC6